MALIAQPYSRRGWVVFIHEWKRKGKLDRKKEGGKRRESEITQIRKQRSDKRKNRTKGKGEIGN